MSFLVMIHSVDEICFVSGKRCCSASPLEADRMARWEGSTEEETIIS